MSGRMALGLAAVALCLVLPGQARADRKLWAWLKGCPPSSYTACHYWAPSLYRLGACVHGPHASLYAPLRYPEVPLGLQITAYPCPPVHPADYPPPPSAP